MIAFVVVSSVFAFASLSTGLFASDRAKETIIAGLSKARGTLELRGSFISQATTTGDSGVVSSITFQVSNSAGGEAVDLTPGTTIINYQDKSQNRTFIDSGDYVFIVTGPGGADAGNLVEQAELYEVRLINMGNPTGDLSPGPILPCRCLATRVLFYIWNVIRPSGWNPSTTWVRSGS